MLQHLLLNVKCFFVIYFCEIHQYYSLIMLTQSHTLENT